MFLIWTHGTCGEQVALRYAQGMEGRWLPMVLEMAVGPVDRGACIRDLSQYPNEAEYLFLPVSFISPDGAPRFTISAAGLGVRVIPVRVNVNLSVRTVEQLLGQRKRMHCAAFRFLVCEFTSKLDKIAKKGGSAKRLEGDSTKDQEGTHTVEGLIQGIVLQFEKVLEAHEARNENDYTEDAVFQGLVSEMLDAQRWAVSKLRLWLENGTEYICFVKNYSLREAHRLFMASLARRVKALGTEKVRRAAAALELCKARPGGLLQARVDETISSKRLRRVPAHHRRRRRCRR
jgi:hypothetical protein